MRIIGANIRGVPLKSTGGKLAMNEGLLLTLLIINITLTGGALLGIFVLLGMVNKGKEEE